LTNIILLPFMTQMIAPIEDHLHGFHPRMNLRMWSELESVDEIWVPHPAWVEMRPTEIVPHFSKFFDSRVYVFLAPRFLEDQILL
jgi:hypothetical protein